MRLRPEERDVNFTWREFYRLVNTALNDDIGNFVHRVLSFIYSRFNARVPHIKKLRDEDQEFLDNVRKEFERYESYMYDTKLKAATEAILSIARTGNAYLNRREPWKLIKQDRDEAGSVMSLLINVVKGLGIIMAPFTPRASTKLWNIMNLGREIPRGAMRKAFDIEIPEGHVIKKPEPLFRKLPSDFLKKVDHMLKDIRVKVDKSRPRYLRMMRS